MKTLTEAKYSIDRKAVSSILIGQRLSCIASSVHDGGTLRRNLDASLEFAPAIQTRIKSVKETSE